MERRPPQALGTTRAQHQCRTSAVPNAECDPCSAIARPTNLSCDAQLRRGGAGKRRRRREC
eukprot:6300891-Alexandrium_andersonii.AAC.1